MVSHKIARRRAAGARGSLRGIFGVQVAERVVDVNRGDAAGNFLYSLSRAVGSGSFSISLSIRGHRWKETHLDELKALARHCLRRYGD